MKKTFTIALIAVMLVPVFAFAEGTATTTDAVANPAVSATTSAPGLTARHPLQHIFNKVLGKIEGKGKGDNAVAAVALTADQQACITTAIHAHVADQKKAITDKAGMIADAEGTRGDDLIAALSKTGKDRIDARKAAMSTFRGMMQKTEQWYQKALKMSDTTFQTTVKTTCKITAPDVAAMPAGDETGPADGGQK